MTFDRLESFGTVGSTMDVARDRALTGDAAGVAILAEYQTGGRGRQGRAWFAPPGANVMMTAIGAPVVASEAWKVALLAAVAAAEGVEQARVNIRPAVRFPNDLYLYGRKFGGILVETVPHATSGFVTPLVGIGVNVNGTDFPPEIQDRATSIFLETGSVNPVGAIAGFILRRLGELWEQTAPEAFAAVLLPRWRKLADLNSQRTFRIDGMDTVCRVLDIGGDGMVTLETEVGERREIHAAQVILGDD